MSAFTIIGVLIFWLGCFRLGMALGFALDATAIAMRLYRAERTMSQMIGRMDMIMKVSA